MNLFRTVAALAVVAVVAAGCNGDPKAEPTRAPSSSTASASPSVEPTPTTKPTLPDAATKPTKAGAEAFIFYYWDVVNYVQATGNAGFLRKIESPTCDTCILFAKRLRQLYRAGGRIEGGVNDVRITKTSKADFDDPDAFAFRVEQTVTHDAQSVVDGAGRSDRRPEGTDEFVAYVLWVDNRWRLDVMDVVSQ